MDAVGEDDSRPEHPNPSDHSSALAEKLLQGWALLQEHCPHCLTPLVRNRQRKMYCVACEQWVMTQSEVAQQILRERVEETRKAEPSVPADHFLSDLGAAVPECALQGLINPANVAQTSQRNQNITEESTLIEPDRPTNEGLHRNAQNATVPVCSNATDTGGTRSSNSALIVPKLNVGSKTIEVVLPNLLSILVCKLEEIGNALSMSQDVNDIRVLFTAVRECLQTIAHVKATACKL